MEIRTLRGGSISSIMTSGLQGGAGHRPPPAQPGRAEQDQDGMEGAQVSNLEERKAEIRREIERKARYLETLENMPDFDTLADGTVLGLAVTYGPSPPVLRHRLQVRRVLVRHRQELYKVTGDDLAALADERRPSPPDGPGHRGVQGGGRLGVRHRGGHALRHAPGLALMAAPKRVQVVLPFSRETPGTVVYRRAGGLPPTGLKKNPLGAAIRASPGAWRRAWPPRCRTPRRPPPRTPR